MRKPAKRAARKPAIEENSIFSIVAAPRLSSPKVARARLAEWLAEVRTPTRRSLERLIGGSPKLATLLAGLAEHSPYLWDLATEKPARLLRILESDPARHFQTLIAKTQRAVALAKNEDDAMSLLRLMKSEAALLIALA